MTELSLSDREWKAFFINDIADILSGYDIYERERIQGELPYVTATAKNNGIGYFIANSNDTLESGCLSVNRNGSVGYCFYHPYKALFGNDTRKLRPRIKNKYSSIFLSVCIANQKVSYGYGRKMGTSRLQRQRILLPVDDKGLPDYKFMEDYVRLKEYKLIEIVVKKLNSDISLVCDESNNDEHINWKSFNFSDVFSEIKRGKRLVQSAQTPGKLPFISSTASSNGVDNFVGNSDGVRKFSNCLTIANSGSVGSTFYHQYEFVASDHVTHLKRDSIDKYAYLFMIPIIKRLSEKYSFNREITDARILREKMLLPVTAAGEIDFMYMSNYVRKKQNALLEKLLSHYTVRLNQK